ncbi:hypothetical protein [Dyella terrae]|uniref:AbiU2 domain-containing protein n=1 Tax=Dyella terrae TaxID=522259 RepID=UPI001EFD7C56|nr:hypothetical protein [Dyella terrae]ULU25281.1 AbiU2 protein [Dyella terrae]
MFVTLHKCARTFIRDEITLNTPRKNKPIANEVEHFKGMVSICEENATMAAMFHETWSPTANDAELLDRMGTSFATNSFHIVAWALRRELILALMRIWDTRHDTPNMESIWRWLTDDSKYEELLKDRAQKISSVPELVWDMLRSSLGSKRKNIRMAIESYLIEGEKHASLERVRTVRNKRLAHHDLELPPGLVDPTNEEVVQLYRDTLTIVSELLHLVSGTAFDLLEDEAGRHAHNAKFFWVAVRGERTEGHPDFRLMPPDPVASYPA